MGGIFPKTVDGLQALPGIGRSTAGAISSIAFDKPAPILDGNVRRVLVRLFAWREDPRSSQAEKQLWQWAELLTPETSIHDYTQAIMDLGAMVCTPRMPDCEECPLKTICQAYKKGLAGDLPAKRKKKELPIRHQVVVIVKTEKGVLLRQRPAEGFLGGLWEFPTEDISELVTADEAAIRLLADLGLSCSVTYVDQIKHTYSHFKLVLKVFRAECKGPQIVAEQQAVQFFTSEGINQLALHGAHKKAFAALNLA